MVFRRPSPAATPDTRPSNRVLHYVALAAIVAALAIAVVIVM